MRGAKVVSACVAGLVFSCGQAALAQSLGGRPEPAVAPATEGTPNIQFEERTFSFGEITDEHTVSTSFAFTNTGDGPLVISNVRGGCGCTVPQLEKEIYQPGERGEITVVFNPAKKIGNTRQKITVTSNDPDEPRADVHIEAFVQELVSVEPRALQLGKVFRGDANEAKIRVTGMKEDFRVVEARIVGVGSEAWEVEVGPFSPVETSQGMKRQGEVTVRVKEDAELGALRGTLILRTNDERKPSLSMTVAGQLAGDVTPMPERLSFGSMAPSQEYKKRIELRSRSGAEFQVTDVSFDGNRLVNMETEVAPGAGGGWVVTLTLRSPEDRGIVRGDLVIKTTLEDEPELRVPMAGAVRN